MSIKRIAELAGVSIATVSNVLNGTGRVSEETAKKVREIAENSGLSLRGKRRNFSAEVKRIAFASADDLMSSQDSFFKMRLLDGIQSFLDGRGYSVLHSSQVNPDNILRQTRDAAAVILIGFSVDPELFASATQKPIIWALRNHLGAVDVVQEDNQLVAKLAAEYLLERGHTHIGYIDDECIDTVVERGCHLLNFVQDAGAKLSMVRGRGVFGRDEDGDGVDLAQTEHLLNKLVGRKNPPTGLFVPGDLLTMRVYSLLRKRGVEPGRDVEIVSCNSVSPYNIGLSPRPAVIDIELETVGRRAAETALWRLDNPGEPPIRLLVRPRLILAESTEI